jgi:hypothetical protein
VNVIGPIIEIETIDKRHDMLVLLELFGTKMILRLGVDPVRVAPGVLKRAMVVDRISPEPGKGRWEEVREIGWANLPDQLDRCEQVPEVINEPQITQDAAVGVMFLLIHELEGIVSPTVLQIGSGGDYLVTLSGKRGQVQVEVSGVKSGKPGRASSRRGEKLKQVRGPGFVSVTTFQHGESGAAHSYLHFDNPGSGDKSTTQKRLKGKKK